ncbi:MAG: sensor histidine kinase [Bdellovibrionia bacterium]
MSNSKTTVSKFENPLFLSLLLLWFVGLINTAFAAFILPTRYTGFEYSLNIPHSGLVLVLLMIISILIAATLWSNMTFRARAEEFALRFDQEIQTEREKALHNAKLSSLGRMAAGIAHEINNPLAIISGKIYTTKRNLKRADYKEEQFETDLSSVQKQVDRINLIIRALKSMTSDASREEFQVENIKALVTQSFEYIQAKFESKQIDFQLHLGNEEIKVFCRPTEISQIFFNLFSNSIDAIENKDQKWIRIRIEKNELNCRIYFSDSGGPLDPELVLKIMEPFYTTKEVGKGTGLGLSLSRAMAENHGGSLDYDFEAPTTTFVLTLPLYL